MINTLKIITNLTSAHTVGIDSTILIRLSICAIANHQGQTHVLRDFETRLLVTILRIQLLIGPAQRAEDNRSCSGFNTIKRVVKLYMT